MVVFRPNGESAPEVVDADPVKQKRQALIDFLSGESDQETVQ